MIDYLSRLIDDPDPVIIMPYGGFANETSIYGQARVLEDEGLEEIKEGNTISNVLRSFKRFETDEIEGAKVIAKWQGGKTELTSDNEGYIYLEENHGLTLEHQNTLWLPISYELVKDNKVLFSISSSLMKPAIKADFGVISDMDETVIETGLGSILHWKVIVNTFATSSERRLPLAGAQEFYNKLYKGKSGQNENPFFYLSNSPWNLHDYLTAFLEKYDFPKGPLLLRDIGLENKKKKSYLEGNKFVKISHILEAYPKLEFILIGDGEDLDPEIYLEIARKFPNRILCIYIRSVTNPKKTKRVAALIKDVKDVKVKLVATTEEAMSHASKEGYIID